MSLEIVNGYVCKDCTDIARAKKGEDPSSKPNSIAAKPDHKALAVAKDDEPRGVNRPLSDGDRGTRVNFLL
jgi:hypothetical protein